MRKGKEPVHFRTTGINPYLQSEEDIHNLLTTEMDRDSAQYAPDHISFYGAGTGSEHTQQQIGNILRGFFRTDSVEVQSDIMAAARSLCGIQEGVVCILGTGSNSCYYNGVTINRQLASLGYIAGDEGSGNHMGKRILQYYAYQTFDEDLRMAFEQIAGDTLPHILHKLYKEPFPNRYLAGFVPLLIQNRGHYMVENIIEDCLNDFFMHHILKYRESWKHPVYFTGSVSWEFRDVIAGLCCQYELEAGGFSKSPLEGLIRYHMQLL